MRKIKGRLLYKGWFNRPWVLVSGGKETDLWPVVEKFFTKLNGKNAWFEYAPTGYSLFAEANSDYRFDYESDVRVTLQKIGSFGLTNVYWYLDNVLTGLSGRLVEVSIAGKKLSIVADRTEKVPGLYYTDGNSCRVPEGMEQTVCKIGQPDCCVFLVMGGSGYFCEKFGSNAGLLLDRLAKGTIGAQRIGNCAVIGRKDAAETLAAN